MSRRLLGNKEDVLDQLLVSGIFYLPLIPDPEISMFSDILGELKDAFHLFFCLFCLRMS